MGISVNIVRVIQLLICTFSILQIHDYTHINIILLLACNTHCDLNGIEYCDSTSCTCTTGYSGSDCGECADGYYKDNGQCTACNCDSTGSQSEVCDMNSGICSCNVGYHGSKCQEKCDTCTEGHISDCYESNSNDVCICKPGYGPGHPDDTSGTCQNDLCPLCNKDGINFCDSNDNCQCKAGYFGSDCNTICAQCDPYGTSTCDDSSCTCKTGYDVASNCSECSLGYYKRVINQETGYFTCQECSNCQTSNINSCEYDAFDSTVVCNCKDGFFGTECEHSCDCEDTGTDRCNVNDGTCLCKIGFYGSRCDSQCTQCNTNNIYYCTGSTNDACACLPGFSSDDGCNVDQCPDCFKYITCLTYIVVVQCRTPYPY